MLKISQIKDPEIRNKAIGYAKIDRPDLGEEDILETDLKAAFAWFDVKEDWEFWLYINDNNPFDNNAAWDEVFKEYYEQKPLSDDAQDLEDWLKANYKAPEKLK